MEKGANENLELVPGINLIASIPPHEYLELGSPKLCGHVQTEFISEFPRGGFLDLTEPSPRPPRSQGSGRPQTQVISGPQVSLSAETSQPELGVFIQGNPGTSGCWF